MDGGEEAMPTIETRVGVQAFDDQEWGGPQIHPFISSEHGRMLLGV
jgi:hypothetical protein